MADLPRGFSGGSDLWDGPLGNSVFFEEFVTAEVAPPEPLTLPPWRGASEILTIYKGVTLLTDLYKGSWDGGAPTLDVPELTGVTGGSFIGGTQFGLDSFSSGSRFVMLVGAADDYSEVTATAVGWTEVASGRNPLDPRWSQWWVFISNDGDPGALVEFSPGVTVSAAVVMGFSDNVEVSVRGTTSSTETSDGSDNSPSITTTADAVIMRSLQYNHITTSVVTYPSLASLDQFEDTTLNGVERYKIAVGFEEHAAGVIPAASWSFAGGNPYLPILHTLAISKV